MNNTDDRQMIFGVKFLVIPILVIPKERPKNCFNPWGKKYYGLPGM